MKIDYKQLECEKQNCSIEIQQVIDKYKTIEITSMLFRNLCQIILENELHPTNIIDFYKSFADIYASSETLEEIKARLLKIIS